jgi:hypothetical protein
VTNISIQVAVADASDLRSPAGKTFARAYDRDRPYDLADAPLRDGRASLSVLPFRSIPHQQGWLIGR